MLCKAWEPVLVPHRNTAVYIPQDHDFCLVVVVAVVVFPRPSQKTKKPKKKKGFKYKESNGDQNIHTIADFGIGNWHWQLVFTDQHVTSPTHPTG